ncbi:hypothetical protein BH09PLA1_BH09PLA1_18020 [soil metagenome]
MRQWNRSVLMFVAGAMACPVMVLGQAAAVPAEPAQDQQIVINKAQIEEARAAAQAAVADAQAAFQLAAADGDGKSKVGYWVARGGKKEKAAFLGVTAVAADAALRDQLKLPRGIGLVIQSVSDETPAAAAGIQEHDVFTKLDDQWLVGQNQLGVLIRMHKAGDEITLTGLRQGSPITLKAKLAEKEMVINDNDGSVMAGVGQFGGHLAMTVPDMQGMLQLEKLAPIADGDDAALIVRENDQTLKVSVKDGQRHLVATDNNNQVLFDGPVETEDQRKALPADLAEKLEKYKEQFEQVKEAGPGNKVRIIKDNR